jgi:hypothetical protein
VVVTISEQIDVELRGHVARDAGPRVDADIPVRLTSAWARRGQLSERLAWERAKLEANLAWSAGLLGETSPG